MEKIKWIHLPARVTGYAFWIFVHVPSTVIRSFYYDASSGTLTIRFVSGSVYAYYEVPENIYAEFRQFREKGVFYNQQIKGKFQFERITKT